MKTIKKKKYLFLVSILILAPVFREVTFGMFTEGHTPFSTLHDAIHTGTEMIFMALISAVLIFIDSQLVYKERERKSLSDRVLEKTKEIKLTQKASIESLAALAEYRDTDTGKHLTRIQKYVNLITRGLIDDSKYRSYLITRPDYVEDISLASILHDIGKVAVPDHILLKPSKLTDEEFDIIKKHSETGGKIITIANKNLKTQTDSETYLDLAYDIALYHHEKWDGSGYPEGLEQEEIPLCARIVALCDVYDAVTSERVYKQKWSHEKSKTLIISNKGTHFDPVVTDVFFKLEIEFNRIRKKYRN